jgi:5-hydroxyisourate hydrolase
MARLSTHVLDTAAGRPAAGMRVRLYLVEGRRLIHESKTNADGRIGEALEVEPGVYELVFSVKEYFGGVESLPFLGEVVVRFGIAEAGGKYHVPLLVAPHGYTTYRGS